MRRTVAVAAGVLLCQTLIGASAADARSCTVGVEQLWVQPAGASAVWPSMLPTPRELLASDPRALSEWLDAVRPTPVSAEDKARILRTLPPAGEVTNLDRSAQLKLTALGTLLRATGRDAVYDIKVVNAPLARVGLYERTVVVISDTALTLIQAEELQALVAHEIGHEYLGMDYERASTLGDRRRLKEVELLCDAIAMVTLHRLGIDLSRLMTGVEKITLYNRQHFGAKIDERNYPTLSERREFARAVCAWIK